MAVLLAAAGIGMWLDRQGGDSIIYLAIFAGLLVWAAVDAFMIPRWVRRLLRKHDGGYSVVR